MPGGLGGGEGRGGGAGLGEGLGGGEELGGGGEGEGVAAALAVVRGSIRPVYMRQAPTLSLVIWTLT